LTICLNQNDDFSLLINIKFNNSPYRLYWNNFNLNLDILSILSRYRPIPYIVYMMLLYNSSYNYSYNISIDIQTINLIIYKSLYYILPSTFHNFTYRSYKHFLK
jgi:hypothetical protein